MARLYRPSIPVETKCRVALRQLGEMWPDKVIESRRAHPRDAYLKSIAPGAARSTAGGLSALLAELLTKLADLLNCKVEDLRLDHDPPLAARPRHRKGLGRKTFYVPDANDPEHLLYRPHGPEFEGSHLIKTNVRGDHGQYPDRVLIKRERRRTSDSRSKNRRPKRKWKGPPLRSANRWPKGRKIQNRRKP